MKIKAALLSGLFAIGCLTASAQEQPTTTENVFNPHWYVQGQIGAQYTLGEVSFSELVSPNAQIGVGYNFTSVFGLRLALNSWHSRAGWELGDTKYKWRWNYIAPAVTAHFNLSNLIAGYNPNRLVNVGVFAGIGANIGYDNDEAAAANAAILARGDNDFHSGNALEHLWDGTKPRFLGQVGATVDFRVSEKVSVGLEVQANGLTDHYNSKRASNADWYFNALVGVKYTFGKTHSTREVPVCQNTVYVQSEPQIIEKVVEKIVEVPAKPVEVKKEPLRRDVFFTISSTKISSAEASKVREVAEYLKANPDAKVTVTGYADKGTGNTKINTRLAGNRANTVVNELINKYGISANRITSINKADSEQPYADAVQNRVAICIAE
jgi:outer membrane protein OmpA-like peptidoglycan-associated protein